MKKKRFLAIVAILLAAIVGGGLWAWQEYNETMFTPSTKRLPTMVEIKTGMSGGAVARLLVAEKLVDETRWVTVYLKLEGLEDKLQAGTYNFPPGMTPAEIIGVFVNGQTYEVSITIPEGLSRREVAVRLAASGFGEVTEFMALTERPDLILNWTGHRYPHLEGFIYPDTYRFSPDADLPTIITAMFIRGQTVREELGARATVAGEFTPYQRLIMASIVEKEAKLDSERERIASVFYNRLRYRRRLESCATVLYAMGIHKDRLTFQDLKYPSPYNTYLHAGLPPTPICNPGRASLAAAYNPETSDYLYFVHKGDGSHEFTRSLTQHNNMRQRYR